jgi:hypothetical protein
MGQYFKSAILAEDKKTVIKWVYSWNYECGLKLMEHSWLKNSFVGAFESLLLHNPQRVVWAGDYADKCKGMETNVYHRCNAKNEVKPLAQIVKDKYIVNHDKKVFVDKSKTKDIDGWKIHPLPLLTCDGNGRGGGDFCGDGDVNLIGAWARDLISVETHKPKGYTEITFDLVEN